MDLRRISLDRKKIFVSISLMAFIIFVIYFKRTVVYKFDIEDFKTADVDILIKELWDDVFTASDYQSLIEPEYLLKTIKFMIKNTNEDDPELIDFVRTIISKPSSESRQLEKRGPPDRSQLGQSKIIDELFNKKRNGFFIEAGGNDGETFSNTLFFETERDWTGILIEPIPDLYQKLISKKRKAYSINACIADNKPFIGKFRVSNMLSGREDEMSDYNIGRVNKEQNNVVNYVYVPCFSLYTILKAIDTFEIDYFSLDVEGGEWSVIKAIPFDKVKIKAFTVEHFKAKNNGFVVQKLSEQNFELIKDDGTDYFFKNKNYF